MVEGLFGHQACKDLAPGFGSGILFPDFVPIRAAAAGLALGNAFRFPLQNEPLCSGPLTKAP